MSHITISRLRKSLSRNYFSIFLTTGILFVIVSISLRGIFVGEPTFVDIGGIESKINSSFEQTLSLNEQWLSATDDTIFIENLWKIEPPESWVSGGVSYYLYKNDSLMLWSNHNYYGGFDPTKLRFSNRIVTWKSNYLLMKRYAVGDKAVVVVLNLYNRHYGINRAIFGDSQLSISISDVEPGALTVHSIAGDISVYPAIRGSAPAIAVWLEWLGLFVIIICIKRVFRRHTKVNNAFTVNFVFLLFLIFVATLHTIFGYPTSGDPVHDTVIFSIYGVDITTGKLLVNFSMLIIYAIYLFRVRYKLNIRYKQLNRNSQRCLMLMIIVFINFISVFFHYSMVHIINNTKMNIELYKFTLIDQSTIYFYIIVSYFVAARILLNRVVTTIFYNFNQLTMLMLSVIVITLMLLPIEKDISNTGYILLIFHLFFLLFTFLERRHSGYILITGIISLFSIYIILFSTIESNIAEDRNAKSYARTLAAHAELDSVTRVKFQKLTYYKIGNDKLEVKENSSFDLQQITNVINLKTDTTVVVGGYIHYVYHASDDETIIVSRMRVNALDYIAFFVYIYVVLYIFCGSVLMTSGYKIESRVKSSRFALRIRFVVVGMVLFTMALVMVVIIVNNFESYDTAERKLLNNQTRSLIDSFERYADKQMHDSPTMLVDWFRENEGDVVKHGVAIYDVKGDLQISSFAAPTYDKMNSSAYASLRWNHAPFYNKTITSMGLTYKLAYLPIYRHNILLGYMNMLKVDRTIIMSADPRYDVLVNIVNIMTVVIFIAVVMSMLLYRMLTSPFNKLYQGMSNIASLKKIEQNSGNDEVAIVIKQYNLMIDYLEESYAALARSEREGAWREMARQVAHEIRNPLTPMRLKIQMLQRAKKENAEGLGQRLDSTLELLLEQIDMLDKIASEFSYFAKMGEMNVEKVSVAHIIKNIGRLYNDEQDIEVVIGEIDESLTVNIDSTQISRVFINLCKNAVQAIGDQADGRISITAWRIGMEVVIEVEDNGSGMSQAVQEKIFQPNFTTKSSGSGLGLAMSRQIVLNFGGQISFRSQQDVGTTFTVILPLSV